MVSNIERETRETATRTKIAKEKGKQRESRKTEYLKEAN